MKSEIEKIKAVLSEINKRNVEKLISTNGNNYSMINILSNPDITNITKALEIAVEALYYFDYEELYNGSVNRTDKSTHAEYAKKSLKQISEILELK